MALAELGWSEANNLRIDWRWAAGDSKRAADYAGELVALRPDVLFGDNTFVMIELQRTARSLPIVFARVNNPIVSGFASSLARPGGNITGFADSEPLSYTKLPEFLKQLAPHVTHVAVLVITGAFSERTQGVVSAASSIGLKVDIAEAANARQIEDVVAEAARVPNGGLIVPTDPALANFHDLILRLIAQYRLPAAFGGNRTWATEGGLVYYGASVDEQYRGAAGYIDRILKGTQPNELPIQQPTRYELVINLKTAKALGIDVPVSMQLVADEVIE
jgi:putative ABC transport system substrate-binding protein